MHMIFHTLHCRKVLALVLVLSLALAGCGKNSSSEETAESSSVERQIYYLDSEKTYLCPEPFDLGGKTGREAIEAFAAALTAEPEDSAYVCLLPQGVTLESLNLDAKGILNVCFSDSYLQMEKTREVLVRAGVVRTFCQVGDVKGVRFTVNGTEVTDSEGKALGVMKSDNFVENAKQINAYKYQNVRLYFATADGIHLKEEDRSIYYSTSKPLEWAIVERLIKGPKSEGSSPTLPTSTGIISVTDSDDICYVNLSQSFITDEIKVDNKIPIYSIVNSICDNCRTIKSVQFSIEGNTHISFRENMSLEKPYTPDMTLIEK